MGTVTIPVARLTLGENQSAEGQVLLWLATEQGPRDYHDELAQVWRSEGTWHGAFDAPLSWMDDVGDLGTCDAHLDLGDASPWGCRATKSPVHRTTAHLGGC